jgi:hypothetical protein
MVIPLLSPAVKTGAEQAAATAPAHRRDTSAAPPAAGGGAEDVKKMPGAVVLTRLEHQPKRAVAFPRQFALVFGRTTIDYWRSAEFQLTRASVILFLSVLFGILFMDIGFNDFAGTQSGIGFFLASVTYAAILFFTA